MTVKVAPEFWVNQGPATDVEANKLHTTAAAFRRMLDGMLAGRPGVVFTRGTCVDLKVLASAVPDVNITVKAGACYVRGTQATDQGMYHIYNDADLVIPLLTNNPANASNPRIDLVVARMQDQQYSGAVDLPTIEMVTGVPAGAPAVPAAPANSIILAQILIPAASATVTQANITDRRPAPGAQPVLLDEILVGTDARYPAATALVTFLNASGVGTNLIPPSFRHLMVEVGGRGDTASAAVEMGVRFNGDATATYGQDRLTQSGATVTGQESGAGAVTSGRNWYISGASANAGAPGLARIWIPNYSGAVFKKLGRISGAFVNTAALPAAGEISTDEATVLWNSTAQINRVDVLPLAGNLVVGSHLALWGLVPITP